MNAFFLVFRVITGMAAAAAFLQLLLIIFLRSALAFAKKSGSALKYVATLFTSGFTQGTAPKDPSGWIVSMPQVGLALLFVSMFVLVFLPTAKTYLHIVAAVGLVTGIWLVRVLLTTRHLEILCLPFFAIWFLYYVMCLFWHGNQPFFRRSRRSLSRNNSIAAQVVTKKAKARTGVIGDRKAGVMDYSFRLWARNYPDGRDYSICDVGPNYALYGE